MLGRITNISETARVRVAIGSAQEGDAADLTAARAEESGLGPVSVLREASSLAEALSEGRVDAAVRGTLPSNEAMQALRDASGAGSTLRVALMGLLDGNAFLLTPVGIDEGRDMAERWTLLKGAARLAVSLGQEPNVAVMSMGRPEDARRGEEIALSHRECESLRSAAEAEGIIATCTGIQLERAVKDHNVVLAPDGVTGNLVFRALHLVAGHESWGAVAMGVLPLVFVDTSREKTDYLGALHLARALASMGQARK
ncbi:MAG: phosphotransacetylase [Thermoplasmata archaeon]|nr:phosphotransacetylase [Thermoplasmata archaeon]NIS11788.1 phosphotransacetylase [Thermoplasmata archaeon]NIS19673.1 phosphotransacetylase [Thermoplasmata archaeon]NIT76852.1 phosphotransacetylase [Thermoplasmata archaeon]NIU48784.1 phosphotransacetylase [Thermoplasmata archaeon]